jgi:hypothetical protein
MPMFQQRCSAIVWAGTVDYEMKNRQKNSCPLTGRRALNVSWGTWLQHDGTPPHFSRQEGNRSNNNSRTRGLSAGIRLTGLQVLLISPIWVSLVGMQQWNPFCCRRTGQRQSDQAPTCTHIRGRPSQLVRVTNSIRPSCEEAVRTWVLGETTPRSSCESPLHDQTWALNVMYNSNWKVLIISECSHSL